MQIEVDMSGRVEETNKPTIVAFSNDIKSSIFFSSIEKQKVLKSLRKLKPDWSKKLINVYVFSVLLVLLLKNYVKNGTSVLIDDEYPGYGAVIKNRVVTLLIRQNKRLEKFYTDFVRVGKKSPAHELAISVFRGDRKLTRKITSEKILIFFK